MALRPALQRFADAVRRPDEGLDLTESALLLAAAESASVDLDAARARLSELGRQAAELIPADLDALQRVRRLSRFFVDSGFRGDRQSYYDARNSSLPDVLERRRGLPITLSVLLMELGSRIGLTLHGVSLPAHFMVKWQDGPDEVFLDPFNDCDLLTADECRGRVEAAAGRAVELIPAHFARVGPRAILRRMLNNLRMVHLGRHDVTRAIGTLELLLILDPDSPGELRDLGHLFRAVGRSGESAVCLERYLEVAPDARDADAIRKLLGEA